MALSHLEPTVPRASVEVIKIIVRSRAGTEAPRTEHFLPICFTQHCPQFGEIGPLAALRIEISRWAVSARLDSMQSGHDRWSLVDYPRPVQRSTA